MPGNTIQNTPPMKRSILLLPALSLAALVPALALEEPKSYEAAMEKARETDRPILLEFKLASCGYCQAFEEKVLSSDTFQEYADTEIVFFSYDLEKAKTLPQEEKATFEKLLKEHEVVSTPTFVVKSPEGEVLWRSEGYGGTPPEEFTKMLEQVQEKAES